MNRFALAEQLVRETCTVILPNHKSSRILLQFNRHLSTGEFAAVKFFLTRMVRDLGKNYSLGGISTYNYMARRPSSRNKERACSLFTVHRRLITSRASLGRPTMTPAERLADHLVDYFEQLAPAYRLLQPIRGKQYPFPTDEYVCA